MANYLLLRDNKESGPFSLEDLVKMGLKPYDLVWVQGKSAAWRYPSELPELKPYAPEVEEQPYDRFYKKPAVEENLPAQTRQTQSVAQTAAVSGAYEAYLPKTTADEQKPVVKRSVFVTMPGQVAEKKTVTKPAPVPKPTPAPIPDYTLQDAEETISITENPVARIKYSQPLDEIKEMYVKTLKDRKDRIARKSFMKISLRRAAVVAGLIGVGVLAGFILKSRPAANSQLAAQQLPAATTTFAATNQEPTPVQPADQPVDQDPGTSLVNNETPSAQQTAPETPVNPAKTPPAEVRPGNAEPRRNAEKKNAESGTVLQTETRKPLAVMPPAEMRKQDNQQEYTAAEKNPVTGERTRSVRMTPSSTTEDAPPAGTDRTASVPHTSSSPDNKALAGLGDKVSVSSNDYKRVALGGIRNLELTVSNHSKYDLDEVAVELQYLKPGDQVLKTQIVQFKSIAANNTETLRIPDTNRGIKVQFRIVRIGSSQLVDR